MIHPEIVDHILSFLRPDFNSLETCSTLFPHLVDRHLYSHLSLHIPINLNEPNKAEEVFYYSLNLSDFVHRINQRSRILLSVQNLQVIINDHLLTPEHLPVISFLLPNFSKLRSIHLQAWGYFVLGPYLSAALQKCFRSPLITEVAISDIGPFPLDLLNNCQNLEKLVLKGLFTDVSTSSYPPLSSLEIDMPASNKSPTHLPKIGSWMNSRTLQSLSLHILQDIDLQPMIEACSPTLITLELELGPDGE